MTTPSALIPGTQLTATSDAIFTASGPCVVSMSSISNPTSAQVTLSATLTRSGGNALDIIPGKAIAALDTYQSPELNGLYMGEGDVITASGAGLIIVVSGYELS